ncbi:MULTISPECIES: TetR/AcrR family transcriptional regulator [unclassified Pseudoalteromonas]|uniref:TetR/AcrR family transcriptional regulator n=1 Tax=unclassified Pseudoalteromonas TaxID=194690 RepID=UPI002096F3C6|nr:TetR/AcrR family transcriptional regulator [Pseudoalteromonas sp. XMcav2-N]MCO7187790.1 TetR/AcrR family transcriptional regulator [Pseudoalteromonas sp. XMcav2-N]
MKKREKTRQLILDESWQLFIAQGYKDTSTRQIATAAGVATGTVFSHFPNKIDILKTAMHQQIDSVITLAQHTDQHHSARLKLRHYASHLFAFYLQHREFSKALLGDLLWHQPHFATQLDAFKQLLFAEQEYNETKATVMMDCYFMTLIQGLSDPSSCEESMLRVLTNKLTLLY